MHLRPLRRHSRLTSIIALGAAAVLVSSCGSSDDDGLGGDNSGGATETVTETQPATASSPSETTEPAAGSIVRVRIELDDDDLGEQLAPDRFRLGTDDDDDWDERGAPPGPALGLEVEWDSVDDRGEVERSDCEVTITVTGAGGYNETRTSTDCSEDDLEPDLPWITTPGDYTVTVSVVGPEGGDPVVAEQALTVEA